MEQIVKDPNKKYIGEQEPFFIEDAQGRVELLRPAGFWSDPVGESNVR